MSIISSSFEPLRSHSPFLIVSVHPLVKSSPVSVQLSSAESCARFSPDKVWVLSASDWQAGIHHASVSHTIKENVSLILQNVIYLAPSWPCTGTTILLCFPEISLFLITGNVWNLGKWRPSRVKPLAATTEHAITTITEQLWMCRSVVGTKAVVLDKSSLLPFEISSVH